MNLKKQQKNLHQHPPTHSYVECFLVEYLVQN